MKKAIYFILAILTIVYFAFMCYFNLARGISFSTDDWILNIAMYGGSAIALVLAIVNFLGNPLKGIFFTLLALVVIVFVLTLFIPDFFRNLFGMNGAKTLIDLLN